MARFFLYKLNKFIVTHWEQNYLNLIQDNDECMKSHSSVAQYWQAKEAMEIFEKGATQQNDGQNVSMHYVQI